MNIKGIGFDYSGVIAGVSSTEVTKGICQILNVTQEQYHTAYYKFNYLANEKGVPWTEVFKMVLKNLDKENCYTELMDFLQKQDRHKINLDVINLVDKLRLNGYRVGLLSNNTINEAKIIRANKINTHFDVFLISEEINASKPSREAFEILFRELKTKAEETIFIDDTKNSLRNADEIAYQPILFTTVKKLTTELIRLGVKI